LRAEGPLKRWSCGKPTHRYSATMMYVPGHSELVRYLYLDEEGIHSLYAQTVERFEVERSVNVENAIAGKVAGTGSRTCL
jgi:hypothetical protein